MAARLHGVGHVFELERLVVAGLEEEPVTDGDAGDDPAGGAPDADFSEVPAAVGEVAEGDGVDEGEGGGEEEAVEEGVDVEFVGVGGVGDAVDEGCGDEVADGHDALGVHVTVGDLAGDEG